jgi:hypothetical protein
MTHIFDVCTDPRKGSTLTGMVRYRDPDNYGFSQGPVFGLQLIMDAWHEGGDFGAEASALSAETAAEFEELFEMYLGRKIPIDAGGLLLEEDTLEPREPRVRVDDYYRGRLGSSSGIENGNRYVMLKPESDRFLARTREIIASFEIVEDEDEEDLDLEDDYREGSAADFTIVVSDPRYLAHFSEAATFQTAFTGHMP